MNMMTHCGTPTRSLFFQSVQEWSQKIIELSNPPAPKYPLFAPLPPKGFKRSPPLDILAISVIFSFDILIE